jgi:sporulation protein YlmC with PRC-barrel domain
LRERGAPKEISGDRDALTLRAVWDGPRALANRPIHQEEFMRKHLITAASVLALTAGAALAQSGTGSSSGMGSPGGSASQQPNGMLSPQNHNSNQTQSGQSSTVNLASAEKMIGKTVVGSDGQKIGSVDDVIFDAQSGKARQLVISSGGFLGIGEKKVAVDFDQATLDSGQNQIILGSLTQQDVRGLSDFTYSDTTTSLTRNRMHNAPATVK